MKLFEKLRYLSHRIRYEATYLEMKYYLKRVLEGKKDSYFKKINYYDRNIGKSCALARLSVKYDIPIAVPTHTWKNLYMCDIPKYIPKYFKKKLPQTVVANEYLRGKRYEYLLVEECISEDIMNYYVKPIVKKGVVGYKNIEVK